MANPLLDRIKALLWTSSLEELSALRLELNDYLAKALGLVKPSNEKERRHLRKRYAGKTCTCCECGKDFPLADNVIDGQVFCRKHRK